MNNTHLAACHCKTTHRELFLYNLDGTNISFRSDELKDKIEYVDDECENDALRWSDIASNSKDYIWSIYCPIYSKLRNGNPKPLENTEALASLLNDTWRILKPNGKVLVTLSNDDNSESMVTSMKEWSKHNGNHPWKIDTEDTYFLGFIVNYNSKPSSRYMVLTKPSTAGRRRKTKRNNRSKSRRIR